MNRLIVAFDNDETIARVKEMLASSSILPRSTHRAGAEVVRAVRFMGGGTVVCGARLADMTADQLHSDLEGLAHVLVVGKPLQLELCAAPDIFKLPLPINRFDLCASVRMLLQLEEMVQRRKTRRSHEETQMIARAKELLQASLGMTEAEAHKCLQKRSMDEGARVADIARRVVEFYSKGGG